MRFFFFRQSGKDIDICTVLYMDSIKVLGLPLFSVILQLIALFDPSLTLYYFVIFSQCSPFVLSPSVLHRCSQQAFFDSHWRVTVRSMYVSQQIPFFCPSASQNKREKKEERKKERKC